MIDLAVANRRETFERIRGPLADRGIATHHVPVTGRTVPLDTDQPWRACDVGYVYPGRHLEGAVADAFLEVPWVNGREEILTSRNKAAVLARLGRAGIPTPRSVYVSSPVSEEALLAAYDRLGPPVVVKPNSTTRGTGVTRVSDPDSLLGVCEYLRLLHSFPATRDRSFLLQEYVPDVTDYRIMVLDGTYAGAVRREAGGDGWRHNVHRGASAVGVEEPDPELVAVAEATAETLDIPLLGVDLLVGDGTVLVNETNARPTVDDPEKYTDGFADRFAALIRDTAAR